MIANHDAPSAPVRIDGELRAFVESGVSVVVGTRDEALVPEIVRAWGPHVSKDRRSISVCVPETTSARTRANLLANRQVAVAMSLPTDYTTMQFKGVYVGMTAASAGDLLAVERHREAFVRANQSIGLHRSRIEALWQREHVGAALFVTIHFVVQQIFNQTPGVAAGSAR